MEKVPPRAPFANANVVRQALSRSNLALAARFEKSGALTRRLRDADFVLDTSALLRRCMDVLRIVFRISLVSFQGNKIVLLLVLRSSFGSESCTLLITHFKFNFLLDYNVSKRLGEKKYKEDWMIWIRVAHSTTRRRAREQHLAVARGGELGRGFVTLQAIGVQSLYPQFIANSPTFSIQFLRTYLPVQSPNRMTEKCAI